MSVKRKRQVWQEYLESALPRNKIYILENLTSISKLLLSELFMPIICHSQTRLLTFHEYLTPGVRVFGSEDPRIKPVDLELGLCDLVTVERRRLPVPPVYGCFFASFVSNCHTFLICYSELISCKNVTKTRYSIKNTIKRLVKCQIIKFQSDEYNC